MPEISTHFNQREIPEQSVSMLLIQQVRQSLATYLDQQRFQYQWKAEEPNKLSSFATAKATTNQRFPIRIELRRQLQKPQAAAIVQRQRGQMFAVRQPKDAKENLDKRE